MDDLIFVQIYRNAQLIFVQGGTSGYFQGSGIEWLIWSVAEDKRKLGTVLVHFRIGGCNCAGIVHFLGSITVFTD
ncbi:hypothetical protein D3C85_1791500 [compost metagenome]